MGEKFDNLVSMYEHSVRKYANNPLFGVKRNGRYQWMTYREFGEQVDALRSGLARLGIGRGDTVAIIANNRMEWAVTAYATYGRGASFCPMYEAQLAKDWEFILRDSAARMLVVANQEIYDKTVGFLETVDTLETILFLDGPKDHEHSYHKVLREGQHHPSPSEHPGADDLAGFIYTSGTTGQPKGVLLTHENLSFNVQGVLSRNIIRSEDVSLAFLPWAHSFGQNCELHVMFALGAAMGLVENVQTIIQNMTEVRPTVLFAVPRIFNRIYDGLNKRMADEPPVKRTIFEQAMANADRMREQEEATGSASLTIRAADAAFDKLVFSTVREGFGGKLRLAISGGAALSPEVARFIDNLKIKVYEGYGLTETSPLVSVNLPGARKIGSVGRPIPGVEILIRDVEGYPSGTGEICVRGPNVMQGYHNLPEETAEVLDEDRTFHTGDLGRLDEDGYLWILGRVKEQYKLENGKYVVPAPIEETLTLSTYILQAMVEGTNRPHNVALLVVDREALEKWAGQHNIPTSGLLEHPSVQELYRTEVDRVCASLKSYERPRRFKLLDEEWTTDNDMLTPKMSLKRRVVMSKYGDTIDALYG